MVRVRRIRLADHRGRDATVLLLPVGESVKNKHQDTNGNPVHSVRRVRATSSTCTDALYSKYSDPEELSRALIARDPDIDFEITGRATGPCDRVHIDGDGQILFAPSVMEVRCAPDGLECKRRPITVRASNLVTPTPPVWSGVLLPRADLVKNYALTRAYQVVHSNALEFDFLFGIASYLDERKVAAQVGSGRRGNGPLIFERNGLSFRGFLDGRIQADAMRLILYLAAFDLTAQVQR
ncbi:MAG: hypothetical protein ACYC1M_18590 [Armatimonadota bacterium]